MRATVILATITVDVKLDNVELSSNLLENKYVHTGYEYIINI